MINVKAHFKAWMLLLIVLLLLLTACSSKQSGQQSKDNVLTDASKSAEDQQPVNQEQALTPAINQSVYTIDEQPGEVYYEIFVRAFYDSDGDGIGDFNGVTEKLDYLADLGVGGIWLMPINESPSYHGYDTTDYYAVNSDYGTIDDFKRLIDEAHKRDIKVIMDLVVNHSSKEHPWFKSALSDENSPYRNWYTIVNSDEEVSVDGAVGSNPWHKYGSLKYLGIFWEGMPDLNFDEPEVRAEMIKIGQFWLEQGVDGFRLDAAKHIFGDFTSTASSTEVQEKNKLWWQEFRLGMNEVNAEAYLIGEVWDSVTIIAPYFDQALNSAFHFDLADRLLGIAASEKDSNLAFSLRRTYGAYEKASQGTFVDAPFLSNHDQNRVMTVLNNNVDHAKMAASLLLTLPGTPYIYYGEEIGMKGAKPDEYIREPMIWYQDEKGGEGQTKWIQSRHNREAGAISVEAQLKDQQSLLYRYKQLISWRNEEPALRDGGIDEYKMSSTNDGLSAYLRVITNDRVLVVHNLSGETLSTELQASDVYGEFSQLVRTTDTNATLENSVLTVPPYSTVIIK